MQYHNAEDQNMYDEFVQHKSVLLNQIWHSVTWWSQPVSNKPILNDSDNGILHSELLGCQALSTI
jgi:hypothetical protein